jgi:hypothetical protein
MFVFGVGVGGVARHGIYSIGDKLCDDLEDGGSNGYKEEV